MNIKMPVILTLIILAVIYPYQQKNLNLTLKINLYLLTTTLTITIKTAKSYRKFPINICLRASGTSTGYFLRIIKRLWAQQEEQTRTRKCRLLIILNRVTTKIRYLARVFRIFTWMKNTTLKKNHSNPLPNINQKGFSYCPSLLFHISNLNLNLNKSEPNHKKKDFNK